MQTKINTRRSFLKNAVLGSISAVASPSLPLMRNELSVESQPTPKSFLFQGDSITDGNRGRNNDPNHVMGHGYAFSIASRLGARFPERALTFYNRGVSGNTIADLTARWQKDVLDLKPNVLSILVGVNDVEQALRQKDTNATKKFEDSYEELLTRTKKEIPDCLLVLCEPFIAPVGRVKENWNNWQNEMQQNQDAVRRLATEYRALFVPLQQVFDEAAAKAPADYWIWDGIHPTVAGHELIVKQWLKQTSKQLPFLEKAL